MIATEETFIGLTTEYPADSLGTIALGELTSTFPDLDLRAFSSAMASDPNSIVYAFQAIVPLSEFPLLPLMDAVPEPSAIGLILIGLLPAITTRRRR
jgi:hypothetical protein